MAHRSGVQCLNTSNAHSSALQYFPHLIKFTVRVPHVSRDETDTSYRSRESLTSVPLALNIGYQE